MKKINAGFSLMLTNFKKTSSLSKKELIYSSGTYGIALWLCKHIFINRSNSNEAKITMRETTELMKRENVMYF